MKKLLCALFVGVLLAASLSFAAERRVIRLGLLTKLNSTEEEFSETWRRTFAPNNERLDVVVRFYDSLTAMQMALNAFEINEMVLPEAAANYLLAQTRDYEVMLVLQSRGMGLAFGFREDSTPLRDKFNEALASLQGEWLLAALEGRYIASPSHEDPAPVKFETFEGAETIRVAVTGDLPPIDFIAADGTPAGFNTAVLAEVGRVLRMNVELVNVEAGARTAALASGRVDAVFWYEVDASASAQPDVPEGVILSAPYYEWTKFMHLRKASPQRTSTGWNLGQSILDLFYPNR